MTAYNGFESPINLLLKSAWESANERVKNNPDLRIIEDTETGYPQVVTKEEHERYIQLWESFKPKFHEESGEFPNSRFKPLNNTLFVFGTGGGIKNNKDLEKIYKNGKDDNQL